MPELDRARLAEEFGLDPEVFQFDPDNSTVDMEGAELSFNRPTEKLLRDNIERAEAIFAKVQHEIENGNFTARMIEVAALIVNSITSTVKEIQTKEYNERYLALKDKLTELKKYEIDIKKMKVLGSQKPANQNIIFTDRETLLKTLGDTKRIENKEEEK